MDQETEGRLQAIEFAIHALAGAAVTDKVVRQNLANTLRAAAPGLEDNLRVEGKPEAAKHVRRHLQSLVQLLDPDVPPADVPGSPE